MNAMLKQRILWLDIAKGIAIILMVLGHSSIPPVASNFIWAFHMPLFFVASGYTTNWDKYSGLMFVRKKTTSIMRPFIIYSALLYIVIRITDVQVDTSNLLSEGWGGMALWFVPVLFVSLLLAYILQRIRSRTKWCYLAILVGFSAVLSYYDIVLPWNMSVAPYAVLYIMVGGAMKMYWKEEEWIKLWKMVVMVGLIFLISQNWRLDMCENKILPLLPLFTGAMAGVIFVFSLSYIIENNIRVLSKILQYIGRETYIILAFSQIIIVAENHYGIRSSILKYAILILTLYVLICLKNVITRCVN